MTDEIKLTPFGLVHNEYVDPEKAKVSVAQSTIEIFPGYTDALLRLNEHSHIWLLGWFHQAKRDMLRVVPRINKELPEYGVFSLRAFNRSNPIGLSVVKLESIQGKIFPGTKDLSVKAVIAGGGLPHRLGLSETILIFKQHMNFIGGIGGLISKLSEIKTRACEKKVLVEVETMEDALTLCRA